MNLNQARKSGHIEQFIKERQKLTGDTDAVTRVIKASEMSSKVQATSKQVSDDD